MTYRKKLIEVALPLEAINREAARDKSLRFGHPTTLHLWWAWRPLPACRAVLFAQLVDDPSTSPERFPTPEAQASERLRLLDLLERLVRWEATSDEHLLEEARQEIIRSASGNVPTIFDSFSGRGAIPLEAQRLGLPVVASDINPVAVAITKALVELPPSFRGRRPLSGGSRHDLGSWEGARGLAEDVRSYGKWIHDEAERLIGHHYPVLQIGGATATVVAWLWARTIRCPNPACQAELPLISSYWLGRKKSRPTWIRPEVNGKAVTFHPEVGDPGPPEPPKIGRGAKFRCIVAKRSHQKSTSRLKEWPAAWIHA